MYFSLEGPRSPLVTVIQPQGSTGGYNIPKGQAVDVRFELDLKPDYNQGKLNLLLKARPAAIQTTWQREVGLEVEVQTPYTSQMRLLNAKGGVAGPGDLAPGTTVGYELKVTSQAQAAETGLELGLSSPEVRIIPNQFGGQDFAPGKAKEYQGKLTIPADFKRDAFDVNLSLTNAAGTKTVHQNKFTFNLGGAATKITTEPKAPPQGQQDWKVTVKVQTKEGQAVDTGQVTLKVNAGQLSAPSLDMAKGEAEFSWTPPADFAGKQALVELAYSGDELDPSKPDRKYLASTGNLVLPPELTGVTRIEVASKRRDGTPAYDLSVRVVDAVKGADVSQGVLEVKVDVGELSGAGMQGPGGQTTMAGKPVTLTWTPSTSGPGKGKVNLSYLGDQADPAKPDQKYQPSQASLSLPPLQVPFLGVTPELIDKDKGLWRLAVTVVDASGRPLDKGKVLFAATGGTFESGAALTTAEKYLKAGEVSR